LLFKKPRDFSIGTIIEHVDKSRKRALLSYLACYYAKLFISQFLRSMKLYMQFIVFVLNNVYSVYIKLLYKIMRKHSYPFHEPNAKNKNFVPSKPRDLFISHQNLRSHNVTEYNIGQSDNFRIPWSHLDGELLYYLNPIKGSNHRRSSPSIRFVITYVCEINLLIIHVSVWCPSNITT